MKAYKHKEGTTIILDDNRLFYLTYEPSFKISFKGKINEKYQPTGKRMKLSQQQHAIFKNIIKVNFDQKTM